MEESCQSKSNSEVKPLILGGGVFVTAANITLKETLSLCTCFLWHTLPCFLPFQTSQTFTGNNQNIGVIDVINSVIN